MEDLKKATSNLNFLLTKRQYQVEQYQERLKAIKSKLINQEEANTVIYLAVLTDYAKHEIEDLDKKIVDAQQELKTIQASMADN